MKIAVLLTGQLRTWKLCRELLKKQLLDCYDCDIFMGIDPKNALQCEYKNNKLDTSNDEIIEAIEFYKPKGVIYNDITDYSLLSSFPTILKRFLDIDTTESIDFKCDNNTKKYEFNKLIKSVRKYKDVQLSVENNIHLQLIFRQYYYFTKAFELMQKYSNDNNTEYDIVVRVRFDQYLYNSEIGNSYNKLFSRLKKNENGEILYNQENINIIEHFNDDLKLIFENISDNEMYIISAGIYYNAYVYVDDHFFYCTYKTAKIFNNFLETLINEYKESANNCWIIGAHIEHHFAKILYKNNIDIIQSQIQRFFIREFVT